MSQSSSSQDVEKLEARISELELIVQKQDQQINEYRSVFEAVSQRLEHLNHQLKEDLKILKNLQMALVPKEIPQVAGMEISTRFLPGYRWGGDYYDLITTANKNKFSLLLSSAGNFGLSALILSVLVAMIPRWETQNQNSSAEITEKIKKIVQKIQENMDPADEWHFLYFQFDPPNGRLDFYHFGELPAFLWRKDGGLTHLPANFSAISKETAIKEWEPTIYDFYPGDYLITASRGFLLEDPNLFQRFFDKEIHWDDVHDLRNQIFREFFQTQKGLKNSRDLTLVVLHFKPTGMRLITS